MREILGGPWAMHFLLDSATGRPMVSRIVIPAVVVLASRETDQLSQPYPYGPTCGSKKQKSQLSRLAFSVS